MTDIRYFPEYGMYLTAEQYGKIIAGSIYMEHKELFDAMKRGDDAAITAYLDKVEDRS